MNSLKIFKLELGELAANCYLVSDKDSHECLVIDPGDSGEFIVEKVSEFNLKPKAIVATHGHFDHIMAAAYLQLTLKLPFYIHKSDEFLVKRMKETAIHFGIDCQSPAPIISGFLNSKRHLPGDHILTPSLLFTLIESPGHTPGSICLYNKVANVLFTGDTIFKSGGVGRTDFSYSDPHQLRKSLQTILNLPPQIAIYPGHGPSTSVKDEREYHTANLA